MAKFADLKCSSAINIIYFDKSNVYDNTIYLTYDSIDSTILGEKYGVAVTGYRDKTVSNRAIFYLFGGCDEDSTLYDTLIKIVVDIDSGGPKITTQSIVSCSTKPPKRRFASLRVIGSYLYLYGGIDVLGNILYDLLRFSLINQSWEEVTLNGTAPPPTILS